jgi:hypothetical protein
MKGMECGKREIRMRQLVREQVYRNGD